MRLIVEQIERPEFVTEANAHGGKDWYICGKYIIGEEKNKNGRVYPISVLEDSVQKYITEKVNEGLAYGELGHPNGPTVNLDRSSHRILSLTQKGNVFEGKSIITNTPHGNTAKGLLESGGKLGVSTRGMGSLQEKNGAMEVQKDFRLSSVDIVADPSGPGCFVNGLMEGVEYFYDSTKGTWREEKIQELATQAKRMTKEEREENALALFELYCAYLSEDKEGKWINAVQRKVNSGRETTKGASPALVRSTSLGRPSFNKSKSDKMYKTTISGDMKEGFRDFVAKHQGKWADAKGAPPKRTEHDDHADRLIKKHGIGGQSKKFNQDYAKFHAMSQGDDFEGGKKK